MSEEIEFYTAEQLEAAEAAMNTTESFTPFANHERPQVTVEEMVRNREIGQILARNLHFDEQGNAAKMSFDDAQALTRLNFSLDADLRLQGNLPGRSLQDLPQFDPVFPETEEAGKTLTQMLDEEVSYNGLPTLTPEEMVRKLAAEMDAQAAAELRAAENQQEERERRAPKVQEIENLIAKIQHDLNFDDEVLRHAFQTHRQWTTPGTCEEHGDLMLGDLKAKIAKIDESIKTAIRDDFAAAREQYDHRMKLL